MPKRNQTGPADFTRRAKHRARARHDAITRPASPLLSLPDNVLHMLFDELSIAPGTVGPVAENADARSLALTCHRLYEYYRCSFAVALVACPESHVSFELLVKALQRLPCVRDIDLEDCLVEVGGAVEDVQGLALGIKSLNLSLTNVSQYQIFSEQRSSRREMRRIVETCRNLEHLFVGKHVFADDDGVLAISEHLSSSLQTLDLNESRLSDISGVHIGKLCRLKSLSLSYCGIVSEACSVTDVTFEALGALVELEELYMCGSEISNTAACSILPNFKNLRLLHLQLCGKITNAVLPFLPPSLVELNLSYSGVLNSDILPSALKQLSNLTTFKAHTRLEIRDMFFLGPFAPCLRVLHISGMGASDAHAAYWVSQMPNLVELDLSESSVSDETARAISCLKHITHARLASTKITNKGVRALGSGVARQSLKSLSLMCCEDICAKEAMSAFSGGDHIDVPCRLLFEQPIQ